MQKSQKNSNTPDRFTGVLTEGERNSQNRLITEIEEYFNFGGLEAPIEFIGDLLTVFFYSEEVMNEKGTLQHIYKNYNGNYVGDMVFQAKQLMVFLAKIKSSVKHCAHLKSPVKSDITNN